MLKEEAKDKPIQDVEAVLKIINDMCDYIYNGEGNKIFDKLNEFIDGIYLLISRADDISDIIDTKKIDVILIQIEKAISIKDYILFTDVLIYELKPLFKNWIELLKTT